VAREIVQIAILPTWFCYHLLCTRIARKSKILGKFLQNLCIITLFLGLLIRMPMECNSNGNTTFDEASSKPQTESRDDGVSMGKIRGKYCKKEKKRKGSSKF
jgi:hypothetical protein